MTKHLQENTQQFKRLVGIAKSTVFHPIHLLIGIPSRGQVSCYFMVSLLRQDEPINTTVDYCFVVGKEIGAARNEIVEKALAVGAEYLLFIDDDVVVPRNTIIGLLDLADQGNDIVAGVCYSKQIPPQPILFKGRGTGSFKNWKVGDILHELDGVGMGLTLIRTDIFRRIKKPWFKTTVSQKVSVGEKYISYNKDESLYFCDKALRAGFKITVDTGIQAIHHDYATNTFYFNSQGRAVAVRGNKILR